MLIERIMAEARTHQSARFSHEVYADEPILKTGRQMQNFLPDQYRKMREISRWQDDPKGGAGRWLSEAELFYRQGRVWCAVLLLVQPVDERPHPKEQGAKNGGGQNFDDQLDNVVPADGFRVLKPGQQRQHPEKLEHKEDANDSSNDTQQTEHADSFGDAKCESNPT